ncbi:MAG TPA: hypothetical protein VLF79_03745 [Candidatus Saccharimonadales bacterium]|nr:hypothetical protein [Candidatus Saccharimonadales bacterium]
MSEQLQPGDAKNPNILPQQMLAELLEQLTYDPHGSLILMQTSLRVDMDYCLGFPRHIIRDDRDAFRLERIQSQQYEAIKNYEDMLILFGRYGELTPRKIGNWLSIPNKNLRNDDLMTGSKDLPTPFTILEYDIHDGIERDEFKRVVRASEVFMRNDQAARDAFNTFLVS